MKGKPKLKPIVIAITKDGGLPRAWEFRKQIVEMVDASISAKLDQCPEMLIITIQAMPRAR